MKQSNNFRDQLKYGKLTKKSFHGNVTQKQLHDKFEIIKVNDLKTLNGINKLIKTSWIKEFNTTDWLKGNTRLNKYFKIKIKLDNRNCDFSKEKIIKDLVLLGKELINHVRQLTFEKVPSDKDKLWLRNMALDAKATLKDRTESCSILIQENPIIYYLEFQILENMLSDVKNKTGILKIIDTILNLVLNNNVFPNGRELISIYNCEKLKSLFQNANKDQEIEISIFEFLLIYFENYLKEWYINFTNVLLKMLDDSLWTIRKKIVTVIYHLSSSISEQKYSLINALVHKFGDREDKVASHSTFLLGELIKKNDCNMLYLIITILSNHISKSLDIFHKLINSKDSMGNQNVLYRQIYRLVLFMSEIKLSKHYNYYSLPSNQTTPLSNSPPPVVILKLCLSLLKIIVESKSWNTETKSRNQTLIKEPLYKLLRVTLNCINRSLPYAEIQIRLIEDNSLRLLLQEFQSMYIPKLYYLCHNIQCGSIRIVILGVLYRISKILNILSDRYYRLFYSQLLYKPLYSSKNRKLLVYLTWNLINDEETSHKISLSIMKRAIQVSIHNGDVSMLLSFLILFLNIIQFNKNIQKKLNEKNSTLEGDHECINMRTLSNVTRELIMTYDDELCDEDEHFFDMECDDDNWAMSDKEVTSNEVSGKILVSNKKKIKNIGFRYEPMKRDPKYTNSEVTHLWEIELMKSYYHPLIVELAYKCLLLCEEDRLDKNGNIDNYKSILSSVNKFVDNFRLNSQLKVNNNNNSINKVFQLSSVPLFLQILSYNPVDINLILLKSLNKKDAVQDNRRIKDFNKWNNKHIPSFLDFYKIYFEDSFIKSINRFDENNSDLNNENEENFEIDYDETTGEIIKNKNKFRNNNDLIIDSLIEDLSNYKDHEEDMTCDLDGMGNFDDVEDIDIMNEVNIDDIEDLDDIGDYLDDLDDINDSSDIEKIDNVDRNIGNKKLKIDSNTLNTITYVDADEMEPYLA